MTAPPAPVAAVPRRPPAALRGDGPRAARRRASGASRSSPLGIAALAAILALVGLGADRGEPVAHRRLLLRARRRSTAWPRSPFTLGWWVIIGPACDPVSFGELFAAYLAGDSINYFTGSAASPSRRTCCGRRWDSAPRLRHDHRAPPRRRARPVALPRSAGVRLAARRASACRRGAPVVALAGLLSSAASLVGLTRALRRGAFGPALAGSTRIKPLARHAAGAARGRRPPSGRADPASSTARRAARHLRARRSPGASSAGAAASSRPGSSCSCCRRATAAPRPFAIESLAMVLNSILLFIPAAIGSAEGVRVGVFAPRRPDRGAGRRLRARARGPRARLARPRASSCSSSTTSSTSATCASGSWTSRRSRPREDRGAPVRLRRHARRRRRGLEGPVPVALPGRALHVRGVRPRVLRRRRRPRRHDPSRPVVSRDRRAALPQPGPGARRRTQPPGRRSPSPSSRTRSPRRRPAPGSSASSPGRYRLGIVSNFYGNLEAICDETGIATAHGCRRGLGARRLREARPPDLRGGARGPRRHSRLRHLRRGLAAPGHGGSAAARHAPRVRQARRDGGLLSARTA